MSANDSNKQPREQPVENAARNYGFEGYIPNRNISVIKRISTRRAQKSGMQSSKIQQAPTPDEAVAQPGPKSGSDTEHAEEDEFARILTYNGRYEIAINTDVSYDPGKEYATKTTNTWGMEPDESEVNLDEDVEKGEQPSIQTIENAINLDECFEVAIDIVKQAGRHAMVSKRQETEFAIKTHSRELITQTDIEVENMIIQVMQMRYPDHIFIGEEEATRNGNPAIELTDKPTWLIDPIDGTMNYIHHFPYFCISLALLVNKKIEFGIVFNPSLNEFYTARRGMGAHLNGNRIKTSNQTELSKSLILQEYSNTMNTTRTHVALENVKALLTKTHALRSIGSSAMGLAMIANGVADGFYYFGLHVWDMVAGIILVTEAGGAVIDPAGGEVDIMSRRVLAAANKQLALDLSKELQQIYPVPRDDKKLEQRDDIDGSNQAIMSNFTQQTDFTDSSSCSILGTHRS